MGFDVTPHIYKTVTLLVSGNLVAANLVINYKARTSDDLTSEVLVIDWHSGVLLYRTGILQGHSGSALLGSDHLAVFLVKSGSTASTSEVAGELRTNASDWTAAWTPYIQGIINETSPFQITNNGPVIGELNNFFAD